MKLLERVRKNTTRVIPDLSGMNYKQRKEALDLPILEERSIREDMKTMYESLVGHDDITIKVI